MKRLVITLLAAAAGSAAFAVFGYAAVSLVSSNTHDRALEAAMTAVFVFGPIGAIVGAIVGARRSRSKPSRSAAGDVLDPR
ncbi:MAG: hypothetical protein IT179_15385 [Acidobacteria bacterium]|nr:hypothetical protein [Acidobacteriota bacterium]